MQEDYVKDYESDEGEKMDLQYDELRKGSLRNLMKLKRIQKIIMIELIFKQVLNSLN